MKEGDSDAAFIRIRTKKYIEGLLQMKKIISSILVIAMLASFATAFAQSDESIDLTETHPETLILQADGHGQYSIARGRNAINTVVATATEDAEIYHLQGDQYVTLTDAGSNTFQLTTKLAVNVNDFEANDAMFEEYKVSQEIIDDIQECIAGQKAIGNDEFSISIFAPCTPAVTRADEPLGYVYYTYQGYSLQDYSVKYDLLGKDVTINNSTVKSRMKAYTNAAIAVGGLITNLSIFTWAGVVMSAYDALLYLTGINDVTVSSGDKGWSRVKFDKITKYTSVDYAGTWALGCVSEKYWIYYIDTYQDYEGVLLSESERFITTQVNTDKYTENFRAPALTACLNYINSPSIDPIGYVTMLGENVYLD